MLRRAGLCSAVQAKIREDCWWKKDVRSNDGKGRMKFNIGDDVVLRAYIYIELPYLGL
jgi:hypothetical protein